MPWYPCPVCGAPVDFMRLPRWEPDVIQRIRAIESRMPCTDCGGVPVSLDFDDDEG